MPAGTPSSPGKTCPEYDQPADVTLTGTIGANGAFSVTGRVKAFDATVSSGGLTGGPLSQGQLPMTIALRYNPSSGEGISGSLNASTTAQPTLQPAPAP
jgi:hypothetical protein